MLHNVISCQDTRGILANTWQGALTVAVSFAFFFLLPDFPEESKWLSQDEKDYVAAKLRLDQGKSARERPIGIRDVGRVFKDYKVIVAGFMYFGLIVPAYGYAYFAPGIVSIVPFTKPVHHLRR